MQTIFSFDIGIASIGWAIMEHDNHSKIGKIINAGVYTFPKGEHPKDGSSLALPRREARSLRRRLKRRFQRMENIKKLLNEYGYNTQYDNTASLWKLRAEALERKLEAWEFAKILLYFAKKRGYLSSIITEDEDAGKVKKGIQDFRTQLKESGYKTAGEYLYHEFFKQGKRIKNTSGTYERTLDAETIRSEIDEIITQQRKFGNNIPAEFIEKYKEEQSRKAPQQSLEKMVGKCSFENTEFRAPKGSITFETFRLLQTLNNLRIMDTATGEYFQLNNEQRRKAINEAKQKNKLTYADLRKLCSIPKEFKFENIRTVKKDADEKEREKTVLCEFKLYSALRKKQVTNLEDKVVDEIAYILATLKDINERKRSLAKIPSISEGEIEFISKENTNEFGHLSLKALRKIIPYLYDGLTYDKACEKAGYDFKKANLDMDSITNPVVRKVFHKYKKLLKAIFRKYGKPDVIKIETARELGKSKEDRKKIEDAQKKNQDNNKAAAEFFGENASGKNIVKYKLWEEQGHFCLYSGRHISMDDLKDETILQIDHIIPYSRCFDDSFANKILCFTSENQNKGNKTPYEYLHPLGRFEAFAGRVNISTLNRIKKAKCLLESLTPEVEQKFKDRNLIDTRYITRLVTQITPDILQELTKDSTQTLKVMPINGSITAAVRKSLGFVKERDKDDTHHALDAIILGIITQGYVTAVNSENTKEEWQRNKLYFRKPWEGFKEEVKQKIKEIKVVRFPIKKAKGELHKDTIYANKNGVITKRISVEKLTLKSIDSIYQKDGGAKPLYETLKKELENHDKITVPFYLNNLEVKTVKVVESASNTREINRGHVKMESMLRVDIYQKNGKFYGVPVYTFDVLSKKDFKPTQIAPFNKEVHIDGTYTFAFSLYPDDLVQITSSGGIEYEGYYKSFNISNTDITIRTINGDSSFPIAKRFENTTGIKLSGAKSFEKLQIDYFGNITKVTKENPPYDISELNNH